METLSNFGLLGYSKKSSTSRIGKYLFVWASLFGLVVHLFQHASLRKTFLAYSLPLILAKKIMHLLTKQRWS